MNNAYFAIITKLMLTRELEKIIYLKVLIF